MQSGFRTLFNAAFAPGRYANYERDLDARAGASAGFRLAETPVFLTPDFRDAGERAAREIVAQLSEPGRIARMSAAVPARYDVPNQTPLPTIACLDFAAVRGSDGRYVPQLVELQGFPSLLAFETMQRDAWEFALRDVAGLDRPWSAWFGGLDRASFLALARAGAAILSSDYDFAKRR